MSLLPDGSTSRSVASCNCDVMAVLCCVVFVDSAIVDADVDIDVLGDVAGGAVTNAIEVLAVTSTSVVSLVVTDDVETEVLGGGVLPVDVVGSMAVIGTGALTVAHSLDVLGSKYASGSQLSYKLTLFGVNM